MLFPRKPLPPPRSPLFSPVRFLSALNPASQRQHQMQRRSALEVVLRRHLVVRPASKATRAVSRPPPARLAQSGGKKKKKKHR